MLDWFLAFLAEDFEKNRLLYQILLFGGTLLLTLFLYGVFNSSDDDSDFESEDEEDEEEEDELDRENAELERENEELEKEIALLDEQLGKLDQDEYERGRSRRRRRK